MKPAVTDHKFIEKRTKVKQRELYEPGRRAEQKLSFPRKSACICLKKIIEKIFKWSKQKCQVN
jgi:hypothetical protein